MAKVIARKNKNTLLVEITEYEIARIMGADGLYGDVWHDIKREFSRNYGKEFSFHDLEFDIKVLADNVLNLKNKEEAAKNAAKTLKNLAEALEISWPALKTSEKED